MIKIFLEKLDTLIFEKNINKSILAKECGIPYTTIDGFYKKGCDNIKFSNLQKISNYFKVDLNFWVEDDFSPPLKESKISNKEQKLVNNYRELNVNGQVYVEKQIQFALLQKEYVTKNGTEPPEQTTIYLFDAPASAGTGVWLSEDDNNYTTITVEKTEISSKADMCIRVSGNSMFPEFQDGDIVFVFKQPTLEIGEIGIFSVDGEGYIKKFGDKELLSLNPDYASIPITSSTVCYGKVIGKL